MKTKKEGKVFLVGAGPGDDKLITLKGIECLKKADVIVYDRLINKKLLRYANKKARLIYCGKESMSGKDSQSEINRILLNEAEKGKQTVRLKGGDPYLFGRGGEEAEMLASCNIPFEVIPGVSSALAVPAIAGIPVTHRDFSSSVLIVTGARAEGQKSQIKKQMQAFKKSGGTLIILMGAGKIREITEIIAGEGISKTMSAVVIERGTTAHQRIAAGTVGNISNLVEKMKISSPSIFMAGKVIRLMNKLNSISPLSGKRVLITSSGDKAAKFSSLIKDAGGIAIKVPVIKIVERKNEYLKSKILNELKCTDWLIFSSTNGVKCFKKLLGKRIKFIPPKVKVCAIGIVTAESLKKEGLRVDFIPNEYSSKGILKGFSKSGINKKRIILFRAEQAGKTLPAELKKLGAIVKEFSLYDIAPAKENKAKLNIALDLGVDIITFTSASAVRGFAELAGKKKFESLGSHSIISAIGDVTAGELKRFNIDVNVVPQRFTIPDMISAIESYFFMRG
ncbi:MAG: uroporphyrinogen-III C-methyltransferase [Candidatus Schekmanbacteria bacterium]|nr:uroporphyrinogen-III C-methyltransferase [Candidatus Schekmanbacteria bacterium]